jgi:hypothetical protein
MMGDPFATDADQYTVTWSLMFSVKTVIGGSGTNAQSKVIVLE